MCMVHSAALRQTIRRCTAVIVLALGILGIAVADGNAGLPILLALAPALYLVGSFINHTQDNVEQREGTD